MPKNHSHSQGSFCHNFVIIIIVIHALIIFINKSIFVTHQKFSKPIFHPWRFTTAARTTQLQIVGKDPLHLFIRTVVVRFYHFAMIMCLIFYHTLILSLIFQTYPPLVLKSMGWTQVIDLERPSTSPVNQVQGKFFSNDVAIEITIFGDSLFKII